MHSTEAVQLLHIMRNLNAAIANRFLFFSLPCEAWRRQRVYAPLTAFAPILTQHDRLSIIYDAICC